MFRHTNPHAERARVLLELRRFADAEQEIRRALAIEPNDSLLHAWLSLCLLERNAVAEAEAAVRSAIGADPENAFAHYQAARVAIRQNNEARAFDAIDEALRLDPTNPDFHYLLAAVHFDAGRWRQALRAAEQGLVSRPDHVQCANVRGLAMARLGNADEAQTTLDRALADDPEYYWSHENRGALALADGDVARAFAHYREALRLNPSSEAARQGLVQALKSRHFTYRVMLWLFDGTGRGAFWGRLLAGMVAVAVLTFAFHPIRHLVGQLILATVTLTALYWAAGWLAAIYAEPFFVLLLRFDRLGRRVLTRDEVFRASVLLGSLPIGVGLLVAAVVWWMPLLAWLALPVLLSPLPLIFVFRQPPGVLRLWAAVDSAALIVAAVFFVRAAYVVPAVGFYGTIVVVIGGQYLIAGRAERRRARSEA